MIWFVSKPLPPQTFVRLCRQWIIHGNRALADYTSFSKSIELNSVRFFFLIFVMFMMFVVAWCPVAQQRNAFAVADSDTVHMAVLYIRCTVCITHEVPSCRHTRLPVSHASIAKRHRSTAIFPVIHMHDWKCLRKCHSLRGDIKIREGTVSKPYIYIYMYTGYFRLAA